MLFIRVVDQISNDENIVIYMTAWDCRQLFWWNNTIELWRNSLLVMVSVILLYSQYP